MVGEPQEGQDKVRARRLPRRIGQGLRRALAPLGRGLVYLGRKARVWWDWLRGVVLRADEVLRFDLHQRAQHFLLMVSVLVLTFTGLPEKFWDFGPSQAFISFLGGLERVQDIHHIAAYVMGLSCVYHALYLIRPIFIEGKLFVLGMIPRIKDFLDLFQTIRYWLGFAENGPRFGRYSYLENFDYWAVFWGVAIMAGSGAVLMWPELATRVLPGGVVLMAYAAHSDEAILAVGWIFLVHIVRAHFFPGVFPFNTSIFTGRVPLHRYQEEHPLEYEAMLKKGRVEEPSGARANRTGKGPAR